MKQLKEKFKGRGEVKGFIFTQIKKSEYAYLYEVKEGDFLRYEIFKHVENKHFNCVSYPSSKAFGSWAWTTDSIERAFDIFNDLNNH